MAGRETAVERHLPEEILMKIFQSLPHSDKLHVEQVCTSWRNASKQTWNDIYTLHICNSYLVDPIKSLRKSKDYVRLHESVLIKESDLYISTGDLRIVHDLVSRVGRHIRRFVFDRIGNHRGVLSIITSYCHNIEAIKCHGIDSSLTQEYAKLFDANRNFRSVQGSGNIIDILPVRDWRSLRFWYHPDVLSEIKLISIIENSKSLEEFQTFRWSRNLTGAISKYTNLKILYFEAFQYQQPIQLINDAAMLERLTSLKIELGGIDDHLLKDLLEHCRSLRSLWLHCGPRYGLPAGVEEALLRLPQLEALDIWTHSITNATLIAFTKLKHLVFHGSNSRITRHGVLELIRNSEQLETLGIQYKNIKQQRIYRDLVNETSTRRKSLRVLVSDELYKKVWRICEKSKIELVKYSGFVKL